MSFPINSLVLMSFLFFISLTYTIPTAPSRYFPITRSCSTPDPSQNLSSTHEWLRIHEPEDNDLENATTITSRHHLLKRAPISIPTYFHIVSTPAASLSTSPQFVTTAMLDSQLEYLNTAFFPFGITFNLISTTRTTNADWASNADDLAMKRALRQGTYSALNIYFQSDLQEPPGPNNIGPGEGSVLLGFCTLPTPGIPLLSNQQVPTNPEVYVEDGCNILSSTLPGGSYFGYNLGGTTVHEVGHFLGLLHTFHGESCAINHFGDFVADTPQQSLATEGCPEETLDSCPESGGNSGWVGLDGQGLNPYTAQGFAGSDAKENFMDYSSDSCYNGFTPGQVARGRNLWGLYRRGR